MSIGTRSRRVAVWMLALFLALAGCQSARISDTAGAGQPELVFEITGKQADRVLKQAMEAYFDPAAVQRSSGEFLGWTARMTYILQVDRITAVAVPETGVRADGTEVRGYTFRVTRFGTSYTAGGARTQEVYERALAEASRLSAPLPVSDL